MKLKFAAIILNDELKTNENLNKIDELLAKEVQY